MTLVIERSMSSSPPDNPSPRATFDDVTRLLPGMTPDQLRQVIARSTVLLGGADHPPNLDTDLALVHSVVSSVLASRGTRCPPLGVIVRQSYFPELRMGAQVLCEYVDKYVLPSTRGERAKALRVFIEMIVRGLPPRGIPVTVRTVCQSLTSVGAYVEQQFPGYLESGLLPVVVRRAPAGGV